MNEQLVGLPSVEQLVGFPSVEKLVRAASAKNRLISHAVKSRNGGMIPDKCSSCRWTSRVKMKHLKESQLLSQFCT